MIGFPAWARQFSWPSGEMDDRVLAAVVGTHSQALANRLVTTYGDRIAACSEGVLDLIQSWCRTPATYETAWDPVFGRAKLALTTSVLDPREVAVRLALRLTETGVDGAWRGTITPSTLRLGGLVLPGVASVEVDGHDGHRHVAVRAPDGSAVDCRRGDATGEWVAEGMESLPSVGMSRPIYLLGASVPPAGDGGEQSFEGVEPVESADGAVIERFREAVEVVAACAPDYLGWIELALRGILVCRREDAFRVVSGSGDAITGVIHVSYPASRMDLAEVLVHEAAHQYFYMLDRVGPVDDGTDRRQYWSPPIRSERPLSRILMAYHALANVRLFYEAVRAEGIDDGGYVDRNERIIVDSIARLDEPVRGNPALTPLGRALYEPLAERMAALAG